MSRTIKILTALIILGIVLIIVGAVLGFSSALDGVINNEVKSSVRLENGTEQYERWEKLPFSLKFKIYAFNVTNPDDVINGDVPKVEEIGPFVYNQNRKKEDIEYTEEDDILSYQQRYSYEFDEETSKYGKDFPITVLNLPLQGIFQTVENPTQVGIANRGWRQAFQGDGMFHTVPAHQYFFEGYQFCKKKYVTSVSGRALCTSVKLLSAESQTITSDADKIQFSFFSHKNDSTDKQYEISAGLNDIHTLGQIYRWDNKSYLDTWIGESSKCNQIRGRDSSIYPPFNNDSSNFDVFNTDICRIVNLKASGEAKYEGINGIIAKLGMDSMTNDNDNSCYCINKTRNLAGNLECLPNGFGDMYNCLKAPVIISFPHMLWADEEYRKTVSGLHPEEDKHATFVTIEPVTGSPLQGAKRIQFNMIIRPINGIDITQNITAAMIPIVWVEEALNLPEDLVEKLKSDYFNKLKVLNTVAWVLIGFGIAFVVLCSGYLLIKKCL